jgi:hypothetical protein
VKLGAADAMRRSIIKASHIVFSVRLAKPLPCKTLP